MRTARRDLEEQLRWLARVDVYVDLARCIDERIRTQQPDIDRDTFVEPSRDVFNNLRSRFGVIMVFEPRQVFQDPVTGQDISTQARKHANAHAFKLARSTDWS